MMAYAVAITEENIKGIILSEAGPDYDPDVALEWLKEYEHGWFIRDTSTVLDCSFFVPEVFAQLYAFLTDDETSLLRVIVPI